MKRVKKILKWTALLILVLIVGVSTVTALRQNLHYSAPYPNIQATTDSAVIARGRHLAMGPAHCIDCHGPANYDSLLNIGQEAPLTGGFVFDLPLGKFYTPNITPDTATGIGKLTDAQIARSLRYGVHADETLVLPFMPFQNMSDEDLTAIISYLRSQKPVVNKVPAHSYTPLGNAIKAFMLKPVGPNGEVPKMVARDTTVAYGKYLALHVAECNGCHTMRDMTGGFVGEPFAGGGPFEEPGKPTLTPPNLTPDSSSRIFGWTQQNFIDRFRLGKIIPHTHMPWNAYKRMSDDELKAIYKFLRSLKPAKTAVPK